MHQTFYIDIEEEISSVVDRLNKSMSIENYFVVPKRALFLQSIVNLKLLKREADKVRKQVIIVTQDEIGASMAQRSGLEVRATLDGLEPASDAGDQQDEDDMGEEEVVAHQIPHSEVREEQIKQVRLSGVGSSDFYTPSVGFNEDDFRTVAPTEPIRRSIPVNSMPPVKKETEPLRRAVASNSFGNPVGQNITSLNQPRPMNIGQVKNERSLDSQKEKALEKMYSQREFMSGAAIENKSVLDTGEIRTGGRVKKIFFAFIGLCAFAFVGVAVYLFLPSAKISVEPNILKSKVDLELRGSADLVEVDDLNIPIRIIDKNETISLSYDVKGLSAVAGKKAHGSVVIYNEYDSSVQTLIATTRLESADGKIFRLVKNVAVPGMTKVGGEIKPGVITAEVIADQAGTECNIEAADFTIPGFKDGPKYAKFYAKSSQAMVGGSLEGSEQTGGKVTQRDLDSAKQKTELAIREKIAQAVKDGLNDGEVALEQAEKITISRSSSNAKLNDMMSTFEYNVSASVRVLVFAESDVRKIMEQSLKASDQLQEVKKSISKVEYGTVDADFEKNTLKLKVYGEITATPVIDSEKIKKELLGKADDQLAAILRKYPAIKSANVEFQPTFVSRIPQYAQRVTVQIDDNE
ncbi:MAG: hypothetical protein HGA36_02425 [Candidatus Moranbacteria bacterium]|nr:hypothetical protein [Candidatus Moranbacteria bacterium]